MDSPINVNTFADQLNLDLMAHGVLMLQDAGFGEPIFVGDKKDACKASFVFPITLKN